jgi:hypothetical protein
VLVLIFESLINMKEIGEKVKAEDAQGITLKELSKGWGTKVSLVR